MGILSSTRSAMKKIIESSYSVGQFYGEMKKVKNGTRQKLISQVVLTDKQKKEIDDLFQNNYGKKVKYDWHRLYQSFTGKFDSKYFPEYLFSSRFEPKMNAADYRYVLDDKLLLPLFCVGVSNVRTPHTLFTVSEGMCFDERKNLIDFHRILPENVLGGGDIPVIIKPVQDTSSGIGVEKVQGIENIKKSLLLRKGQSVVVQECIAQNEQLNKLYPDAVNTFRVITYIWNGKIYHVPLALRIGQGGSFLDNAHAGGMFIGVSDDGELGNIAFTESGLHFEEHPDTNIKFDGYKLEFVPEIIETAKKMHLNAPQLGIISWDMTIDKEGMLVLIEANTRGQSIWFPQMANGRGAFGDNTEEILKYISH